LIKPLIKASYSECREKTVHYFIHSPVDSATTGRNDCFAAAAAADGDDSMLVNRAAVDWLVATGDVINRLFTEVAPVDGNACVIC
jgi:hypothetical protein